MDIILYLYFERLFLGFGWLALFVFRLGLAIFRASLELNCIAQAGVLVRF